MNEVNVSADCAGKRKADGKLNNKGFSLVEMLIALTIGGIVLSALVVLIQSSVHNFTKQTAQAQLQSDADIALNQVENDIMEADMLIMYRSPDKNSGYDYYLTKYSNTNKSRYYGYIWDKANKILYFSNDFYPLGDKPLDNVSVACEYVEDFSIKIDDKCVSAGDVEQPTTRVGETPKKEEGVILTSNIKVKAYIKLSKQNVSREVKREVSLRNSLYGDDLTNKVKIVKVNGSDKTIIEIKYFKLGDIKEQGYVDV